MSAASHIPALDPHGLRRFAWATAVIVAVLFGLALPWLLDRAWPLWPWLIALVLGGWGLLAPASLRPLYRGWMRFGLIMHRLMSPLILALVFFLIITPVALFMKLARRDALSRGFDAQAQSYRITSRRRSRENMERPF